MMFRFATLLLLVVPFVISLYATEEFSDFIRLGHSDDILEGYDSSPNPDQSNNLKRTVKNLKDFQKQISKLPLKLQKKTDRKEN